MHIEEVLKSIPLKRRASLNITAILCFLAGPVYMVVDTILYGYAFDAEFILFSLMLTGLGILVALPILYVLIFPSLKNMTSALEKAEYMYSCVSKLDAAHQIEIQKEITCELSKTWRSKSYITSGMAVPPHFGKHCIYGKVVAKKTLPLNQHVILPYKNISEVITAKPATSKSDTANTARTVFNTLSVVGSVASIATGGGGSFVHFAENAKRPTIAVIDDAGNIYQIDCPDPDSFLEELGRVLTNQTEQLPS